MRIRIVQVQSLEINEYDRRYDIKIFKDQCSIIDKGKSWRFDTNASAQTTKAIGQYSSI